VAQLTSLNDINRLLHETLGRERAIDGELEDLLAKRGDVEGRLLDLRASTAEACNLSVYSDPNFPSPLNDKEHLGGCAESLAMC